MPPKKKKGKKKGKKGKKDEAKEEDKFRKTVREIEILKDHLGIYAQIFKNNYKIQIAIQIHLGWQKIIKFTWACKKCLW